MEEQNLLAILKKRYDSAKKFTQTNYIDQAKRAMKDYDTEDELNDTSIKVDRHAFDVNKRYEMKIPMIFTNTEAMKAALFERLPDLIIKGRGSDDEGKRKIVDAAYEYLKDKLDLFDVADQAAHWFILTGFCSAQANFESRGAEVPLEDGSIDETGKPLTRIDYDYNDPIIEVLDPTKTFFASDSVFDYKGFKVPYFFVDKLMTPEEIKSIYEIEVDADTTTLSEEELKDLAESEQKDVVKDLVRVHIYRGELPYSNKDELDEWGLEYDPSKIYFCIFTADKVLYLSDKDDTYIRIAKWYGHPSSFFGFGLGKIGRQFQIEKSIRRGQQIRFADLAAFPKYTVKNTDDISDKDLTDPRLNTVLKYKDTAPGILQPGNLSDVVKSNSDEADQDAQKAFGILDLNTGSQSSTVDTATGQTIFAQAASRRVEFAKKKFMAFYRELIILLLKLCQEYWDEEKIVTIMGEDGQDETITLNKESLANIDFDKDIDIDMETLSVNKDVIRQQYIALYDKTKDDPLINRKNLFADMLTRGFEVKDPNRYIKENGLQPGMVLVNPQTGEQYQVDQSGELVPAQDMNQIAQPGATQPMPTDQSGVNQTVGAM